MYAKEHENVLRIFWGQTYYRPLQQKTPTNCVTFCPHGYTLLTGIINVRRD